MTKAERILILRWRAHLDYMYHISPSREILLAYAAGWLRGAIACSDIEEFSEAFWRAAFYTMYVVETYEG
ncbi:MAG: hypothetical protein MI974_32980 [Chitinophagales bacterium]|nr:hypothetical protein [Chitinophagales bacterium]